VRTRALLVVAGGAVLAFGIGGLLVTAADTHPVNFATFLFGGLLAHDAVAAPVAAVVSVVLVRSVPARVRPAVMGALFVSVSLVLVAIPVVKGAGRNPNNLSILPSHHYGRDLLLCIAAVWLLAGARAALSAHGDRERRRV
jgi:hypothetical protein